MEPRWIYFIECEAMRAVKIGIATEVGKRFSACQVGCPAELQVYAYLKGDTSNEKELHHQFRKYHIRGEWYFMSPEIRDYCLQAWDEGVCWHYRKGDSKRMKDELLSAHSQMFKEI